RASSCFSFVSSFADQRALPSFPTRRSSDLRRWHPANDYYGLSALEAARLAVSSDRAMAEWNRSTFGRDNGVPAGIVSVKDFVSRSEEHTSELQSRENLVCRLLLEKKKQNIE